MPTLLVQIDRFISDDQPGFVECSFVDANGVRHLIHDKVPVVTQENLNAGSSYPRLGYVACRVVEEWRDMGGRYVLRVSTEEPDHVESDAGIAEFMVPSAMVETVREGEVRYIQGVQLGRQPCHFGPVLVAVGQASSGVPVTAECPYCGSPLEVEPRGVPPSAWLHSCRCGKCTGSFRGL
jgi:hypothetical protein